MLAPPRIAGHILTYARHLRGGGVERAQLRLAGGWLAAGRRVTLLLGSSEGPLAAELPSGLDVIELGRGGVLPLGVLPRVTRERRPDILFCPGNFYTSLALWTRTRLGPEAPPIVAKMSSAPVRGDYRWPVQIGHRAWLAQHGRFLDHLVTMTDATAAEAARAMGMTGRVSVIPNPPALPIPGAPLPSLPAGRFVLGVGRLVPQKRWDRLLSALAALEDKEVGLVILGEGELRPALEAQVRALGLEGRVLLPGNALDPLPAMARAAVLALTSDFEGVPGVLREALSVGTPVVTTASSVAVGEIVADPALGDVVPCDDVAALTAALARRLAPGAQRPAPVPQPGADAAGRYLTLFDRLLSPA